MFYNANYYKGQAMYPKKIVCTKPLSSKLLGALLSLMMLSSAQAATPSYWKETGYLYNANQTPVKKVLEDFSTQFGLTLEFSPSIKGTVDGRIASNSAIEFLDKLAVMRKFRWFVYSNTLYIAPTTDNQIEKILVATDTPGEMRQVLQGLGLFEPRFGWAELPDEQSVVITGPSSYIRLVKKVLGKQDIKRSDMEIMIFRLKYANADDREIQYRDKTIVVPGITTILRNLLQNKRPGEKSVGNVSPPREEQASMPVARSSGKPPPNPFSFLGGSTDGNAMDNSLDQRATQTGDFLPSFNVNASSKKDRSNPIVEADSRLNAVIIRDDPSKYDYYKRLIDQFDAQPKMVEIEAMIIDVNRSKMRDIGIDFGLKAGDNLVSASAMGRTALGAMSTAASSGASFLLKNLDKFYASIHAMEQEGDAYVLAKPSVLTEDNTGAVLDLSQTAYINVVGERVANVVPITAGTLLKVTPRVIMENNIQRVRLVVDIEDGTVTEKQGSNTPSVQKSTISTQAIIDENQALVIGGYQSQNTNRFKQRVPLLGDLPFVGGLFTATNSNDSNKERLFVIIPRPLSRQYTNIGTNGANDVSRALNTSVGQGQIINQAPIALNNSSIANASLNIQTPVLPKPVTKGLPPSPFDMTATLPKVPSAPLIKPSAPILEGSTSNPNNQVSRQVSIESLKEPIKKAKPSTGGNKVIEGRQGNYFNANAAQVQVLASPSNPQKINQSNKNIVIEDR